MATAPGRYEAEFTLDKYGSFLLKAEHRKPTKSGDTKRVGVSYGHIGESLPARVCELRSGQGEAQAHGSGRWRPLLHPQRPPFLRRPLLPPRHRALALAPATLPFGWGRPAAKGALHDKLPCHRHHPRPGP